MVGSHLGHSCIVLTCKRERESERDEIRAISSKMRAERGGARERGGGGERERARGKERERDK
jgi:hypothetical protein